MRLQSEIHMLHSDTYLNVTYNLMTRRGVVKGSVSGCIHIVDRHRLRSREYYSVGSCLHVTWISTDVNIRGRGYGKKLLRKMLAWCRRNGVKRVTLIDASDRYRKPGNLYVNHGFQYMNDEEPDMIKIIKN